MNVYIQPGTVNGENVTSEVETKDSLAKKIISQLNRPRYYVKTSRGKMIDPESTMERDRLNQKWTSVDESIFNLYTKFLRTGRVQFLISAERKR